jgi:hypothetical protein
MVSLRTCCNSEFPSDLFTTDTNLHLAIPVFALRFEATTVEEHICCLVIHPFFGAG